MPKRLLPPGCAVAHWGVGDLLYDVVLVVAAVAGRCSTCHVHERTSPPPMHILQPLVPSDHPPTKPWSLRAPPPFRLSPICRYHVRLRHLKNLNDSNPCPISFSGYQSPLYVSRREPAFVGGGGLFFTLRSTVFISSFCVCFSLSPCPCFWCRGHALACPPHPHTPCPSPHTHALSSPHTLHHTLSSFMGPSQSSPPPLPPFPPTSPQQLGRDPHASLPAPHPHTHTTPPRPHHHHPRPPPPSHQRGMAVPPLAALCPAPPFPPHPHKGS